jgi:phosphoribosyl 1,2-cyclic phosphodiesterase
VTQDPHLFTVRFWGTRGSIPTSGCQTEKHGGNTPCLEVRYGDTLVVLDAGSGIRNLGSAWDREFGNRPVRAHLLLTHPHWDHIQGFPFFAPAYSKDNAFTIYGEERADGDVRQLLSGQMGGAYFPVPLEAMQAALDFRATTPTFALGSIEVRTARLPHPGGCLGYRLEAAGSVLVFATDCELDQVALNRAEVQADHRTPRLYDPALLDFFSGVHVLVLDCQYTDEQYPLKRGWGHNSVTTVVDLCVQARPEMLVLFHHDPESHDAAVDAMVDEVYRRLEGSAAADTLVLAARERLTLRVGKPIRPLRLPS